MRRRASSNRLLKLVTLPFRALGKARDAYVRGLTSCAGRVSSGGPVYADDLPRSFSAVSSREGGEDFKDLLRAASAKSLGVDVDLMRLRRKEEMMMTKSCSVGMGRIDEDDAAEFGENEDTVGCRRRGSNDVVYGRSRSHAVTKTSSVFGG